MDREWTGNFEEVTSDRFRLNIVEGVNPTVYEFELYKPEETQTAETDKTLLQEAIAEAEEAIESGQTDAADADLRESFMAVYDYALAVNENAASSQDTIDRTYNALTEEIRKLDEAVKPVSKTILETYLNEAKALVEDGTVSGLVESVQKLFDEAIAEGEAVMAKEYATRDEVLQAAAKLMYAVQAQGMLAGDKTDLEMAIELAGMIDLTQYVEAGQAEFTAALAKANEVMEDGDAFQEDVDTAWNALTEAILNLRLKADKSVLEDLISQTAHLDLSSYTEESVVTFRAAFAAAKTVLLDEGLSVDDQAEVDEAVTALQAAYDGLEKVQAEPEDPDAENPDAENPDGDNADNTQDPGGEATDDLQNPGGQGEAQDPSGAGQGGNGSADKNHAADTQNSADSGKGAAAEKAAKTGDAAPIAAAGMMLVLSAGAVVLLGRKRSR